MTLLTVDNIERHELTIPLVDDRQKHKVDLQIHMAHSITSSFQGAGFGGD
jgi:hypothetical protein